MTNPLALARALVREMPAPPPPEAKKFAPKTPEDVWAFFGLTPYPHQIAAMKRPQRFLVDVWHRRAGKSTEKLLKLLFRAYHAPLPRARYAFLGPTYSQVQDIAWAELRAFGAAIPGAVIKESLMAVVIPTAIGDYARIRLYGVDSPKQRLRGSYLDGVVLDEFQHIPEHVWTQQVRPMLADRSRACIDALGLRNQWANFIGTPLGRNHLYSFFQRAEAWGRGDSVIVRTGQKLEEIRSDQWAALKLTVEDTKVIPEDELREIRATTPEVEYAQEFDCDFDAGVLGAIFSNELRDLKARNGVTECQVNPHAEVLLSFDLGLNDLTVCWFFQRIGPWVVFVDCMEWSNAAITTIVKDIQSKGYRLGTAYFPHDVRQRDMGTAKTRLSQFRELGLKALPVSTNVSLQDGIAATRRLLMRAMFDRERCGHAVEILGTYRREKDPTTGLLRAEPVHDVSSHYADALRTAAVGMPRWTGYTFKGSMAEL